MSKSIIATVLALFLLTAEESNAQVNFGVKFGSASYTEIELGFQTGSNLNIGGVYIFSSSNGPGYYGASVRKAFEPFYLSGIWDRGIRPYLMGTVGYMSAFKTIEKGGVAGCVGGGLEFNLDSKGSITIPAEIAVGKMPSQNIISDAGKVTSAFYFSVGTRFYLYR
ncbi:MAG: hypothetical protein ACKO6Q_08355 [Bacteroidota bacterium]